MKTLLGFGALAGVVVLGSTLAASINLNNGGPVEFGQGVTQTTACDNEILVTPNSSFVNATSDGSFMFTGVTLGTLDTTAQGCAGKTLTLIAYGPDGTSLATFAVSIASDGTFSSEDGEIQNGGLQGTTSGMTFRFAPATLGAANVYTITIQSSTSVAQIGSVWTERTSAGNYNWRSVASSSDGTKLVAVEFRGYSGSIHISSDSGATWIERTSTGSADWADVASSSDGTKLVAISYSGGMFTSSDSGATWIERTFTGSRVWSGIASSSDGTNLVVSGGNDDTNYIFTSADSGVTWVEQVSAGNHAWTDVASSSDGTKLAAVTSTDGIFTSSDSGLTWNLQNASDALYWSSVASSSDGTKLVAIGFDGDDGFIFTSSDSGAAWTQRTAAGTRDWSSVALNSDGTRLAAATLFGYIYISSNSGATWTVQTDAGVDDWEQVALSSNGKRIVAVKNGGNIWTGVLN